MSTTIAPITDAKYATFIAEVAQHAADAETTTTFDYFGVGTLVARHGRDRDAVKSDLIAAYRDRGVKASTVNVYLSQGIAIATRFATWNALETFADDELNGSRSLKRIYDAIKSEGKPEPEAAAEPAEVVAPTPLVDVILANLAHLTDAGEIARVRDAAIAMLTVTAVA